MLDIKGIVENMHADGFAVTAEEAAEVHRALTEGSPYTGPADPETVEALRRHFAAGMGDGRAENAGY